jgi:AcrR family transcriptional regulator
MGVATKRLSEGRGASRLGRPPRELAGQVGERILAAAQTVFLERGFDGASMDEIAEVARAGKPTIYARFPQKEALFAAVVARLVRRNTESVVAAGLASDANQGTEKRLATVGAALLRNVLTCETVGLIRSTVAEARRFPELASTVHRMTRERASEALGELLGELAGAGDMRGLPAFAPERLQETARRFADLVLLPMLLRALFGEDLETLRGEIAARVPPAVAFFLAGCREGDAARAATHEQTGTWSAPVDPR